MKKTLAFLCILISAVLFGAEGTAWLSSGKWSGDGILQSDLLVLRGERNRILYNVPNERAFTVFLLESAASKKNVLVSLGRGSYHGKYSSYSKIPRNVKQGYLRFEGTQLPWAASFEQYVSDVDRWELLQLAKKTLTFQPFGAWVGEGGETKEIRLAIPSSHWRITVKRPQGGKVAVELTTEKGYCLFRDAQAVGEISSWGHESGNFFLKIHSEGAPWTITIELAE